MMHLTKKAAPTTTNGSAGIDRSALLAAIPHLRAFARLLKGSSARGDDLVQEAITHALATTHPFLPKGGLRLWLFSVVRALHHNDRWKEGAAYDTATVAGTHQPPGISCQEASFTSDGFGFALGQLPCEEREALILVEATGLTYEECARVCKCPLGAIKKRVSRARERLTQSLVSGAAPFTADFPKQLLV